MDNAESILTQFLEMAKTMTPERYAAARAKLDAIKAIDDAIQSDQLSAIWRNVAELYAAFGLDADSVPPEARRRYLNEEHFELQQASIVFGSDLEAEIGGARYYAREEDVVDEAFDVIYTTLGLLQAHGVTPEQFAAAIERGNAKNAAKRPGNGWAVVAGKIRKVE